MRITRESAGFEGVPTTTRPPSVGAGPQVEGGASFIDALRGVGGAVDRGEALIARAVRGDLGGLDSAQLIALQAGIYRYSEAVDLVAKLVDRATNAIRTVVSPH